MKQTYLHREIWKKEHGSISNNIVVHHLDHNKIHNHPSNLSIMTRGEHTTKHKLTRTKEEDVLILNLYSSHQNGKIVAKTIERSEYFTYGVLKEYGVI
jgi:hypothetical protein